MKLADLFAGRTVALAAMAAFAAGPGALAATAPDPYQPLAFLVGHCWKGTFAGGSQTDEHCFSRIYGGKFIRDEHMVHGAGGGAAQLAGETIYAWNSATRQLEYLYIESTGGLVRGTAVAEGDALLFPSAGYIEGGKTMNVRSRWRRAGDDAYEVATEFEVQGSWVPGFTLRMERARPSP